MEGGDIVLVRIDMRASLFAMLMGVFMVLCTWRLSIVRYRAPKGVYSIN